MSRVDYFKSMKRGRLVEIARAFGLPTSGNKTALARRIASAEARASNR